jgi:hypothetical protein
MILRTRHQGRQVVLIFETILPILAFLAPWRKNISPWD